MPKNWGKVWSFAKLPWKADLQLAKGREVFNHIIGPAVSLPNTWTWVSLIAFPNIRSRQALRDLGVAEAHLPYILTNGELEAQQSKWIQDLNFGIRGGVQEIGSPPGWI